eukprot:COSAG02_NODE_79_length_40228_cov_18.435762_31_plen_70_part_00
MWPDLHGGLQMAHRTASAGTKSTVKGENQSSMMASATSLSLTTFLPSLRKLYRRRVTTPMVPRVTIFTS